VACSGTALALFPIMYAFSIAHCFIKDAVLKNWSAWPMWFALPGWKKWSCYEAVIFSFTVLNAEWNDIASYTQPVL
jgi:hypothetical protein